MGGGGRNSNEESSAIPQCNQAGCPGDKWKWEEPNQFGADLRLHTLPEPPPWNIAMIFNRNQRRETLILLKWGPGLNETPRRRISLLKTCRRVVITKSESG